MSSRSKRFVSAEGNSMRWIKKDTYTKRRAKRKAQRVARRANRA